MPLDRPFLALYPLGFVLAFVLAAALAPLFGRLATSFGIVATPQPDRWHAKPTPMLGGVAIMVAVVVAFVVVPQPIQADRYERYGFLLVGAVGMFLLGAYDDVKRLPPYTKLLGQIVFACLLVFGQLQGSGDTTIAPLMAPLAIIWIVGVSNAFNLLDNMDGLAAGIAVFVGLTLFGLSHLQGDRQTALVALIVVGAAAGFLIHNINPARIFMGDAGSLLIGYLLSGLTLMGVGHGTPSVTLTLLLPVLIMALPILDTSLVAIQRTLNGRSIAQGGRDHLSHRLVALGLSERQAVLVLYLIAGAIGAVAVASSVIGVWATVSMWIVIAVGIVLFGIFMAQVRVYSEVDFQRMSDAPGVIGRLVLGGRYLLYKQQIAAMALDLLLISTSLLCAFLLRWEGVLVPLNATHFALALPIAVSVKLAVFLAMGVYKSVWRHNGLADTWLIVRATFVGSVISGLLVFAAFGYVFRSEGRGEMDWLVSWMTSGIENAPKSVLLIDWILLTALVVASRRSFDLMQFLVAQTRNRGVTRVLVVGAGDAGELVLRTLQRSRRRAYRAVGFLDDDRFYANRTVHGARVLGGLSDLEAIAEREQIDEIVVALTGETQLLDVLRRCHELGLAARDLAGFIKAEFQAGAEEAVDAELIRAAQPPRVDNSSKLDAELRGEPLAQRTEELSERRPRR